MTGGEPVACGRCDLVAEDPDAARLTWSAAIERSRTVWVCDECSRRHLRSIEARLDPDWW
jgi:hypothetical protein